MRAMLCRRLVLARAACAAASSLPLFVAAAPERMADPLRLAVDDALVESGLAQRLQHSFGRDTGLALRVISQPATALLAALERGEHDAALCNAPRAEQALAAQGLVTDRRVVGRAEFVLVGPAALVKPLDAGHDAALALQRLAQVQAAFLTRGDGSGTHLAEQALWRAAATAPEPPWYLPASAPGRWWDEARERNACMLVDRGAWAAHKLRGFAVLSEDAARLIVDVHVMRSFRTRHPSAKLLADWLAGRLGRRVVDATPGYRLPPR